MNFTPNMQITNVAMLSSLQCSQVGGITKILYNVFHKFISQPLVQLTHLGWKFSQNMYIFQITWIILSILNIFYPMFLFY